MNNKFFIKCNLDNWKDGDLPMSATVNICLGDHTTDLKGHILLTADLISDTEVDFWIDGLIQNLEVIRVKAKKKIKDNKSKGPILEIVR